MRRALIKVTGQSQALTHTAGSGRKLLLYSGKERSGSVTETSIDDECPFVPLYTREHGHWSGCWGRGKGITKYISPGINPPGPI